MGFLRRDEDIPPYLTEIHVIGDDSSDCTAVFKVGRGDDGALEAEKLGGLHFVYLAAEHNVIVCGNDELTVADIEAYIKLLIHINQELKLTKF